MAEGNPAYFYSLAQRQNKQRRTVELSHFEGKDAGTRSLPSRHCSNPTADTNGEIRQDKFKLLRRLSNKSQLGGTVYFDNALRDDSVSLGPINTSKIDDFNVVINPNSPSVLTHSPRHSVNRKKPLLNALKNDLKLTQRLKTSIQENNQRKHSIKESLASSTGAQREKNSEPCSDEEIPVDSYSLTPQVEMSENKPFFYCRCVTNYPKTSFIVTFAGQIFIILVTLVLLFSGYDLFPTEFEILPMYNWKVPWRKRDFAWRFKDENTNRYVRKLEMQSVPKWFRSMAYGRANIVLYYDSGTDGNIFTKKNLETIQMIENQITSVPDYTNFCVQTSKLHCTKPTSVIRLFDGTYSFLNPIFNDTTFSNIPEVLNAAQTNKYMKAQVAYFMSKDYKISSTSAASPITRSIISMGYPLGPDQSKDDMEKDMEEFLFRSFKPKIEELKNEDLGLSIVYWSFILFMHDILKQIMVDLLFALGSVLFIFGFMVFHTKSLWISSLAVLSISTSFLCTNMIYRVVLGFRYFGYFHVITIFIVLGIGADDLFIFLDVWKNTAFTNYSSLAHRLSEAYTKSALSMFFTSLTTAAAFFTSALSPLLATYSFGVFAGILVIVNYVSAIVFFPCVVVVYHIYFEDTSWRNVLKFCKCRRKSKRGSSELTGMDNLGADLGSPATKQRFSSVSNNVPSGGNGDIAVADKETKCDNHETDYGFLSETRRLRLSATNITQYGSDGTSADLATKEISQITQVPYSDNLSNGTFNEKSVVSGSGTELRDVKKRKFLVQFFRDRYFRFVTHKVIRWIIVSLLLAMVVGFAYSASRLEWDNEQLQSKLYRSSHNYGKALAHDSKSFIASPLDRNVVVYIVWGLGERDMSPCHFSDPRCVGQETFDKNFNPNTPQAQMALKTFCEKLLGLTTQELDDFRIRRDFASGHPEIKCFATSLDSYMKKVNWTTSRSYLALPWDYEKTRLFVKSREDIYNPNHFNKTFQDYLEIPISYWLNDGYTYRNLTDFKTFHTLIGEEIGPFSTATNTDLGVFYGNKIRYLGIQVNLTLGAFTTGYSQGAEVMNRWEKFVNGEMKKMPPGMQNGFQLTKDTWHALELQKSLADNAVIGIGIGISLALPLLILATMNVIVGSIATFCMCCGTVCVIGVIPLAGWKLGILVSLNICMVVGLSVDYVVHLAQGYTMSRHEDRLMRVRDMLEEIGISVFSGACTTLGASIFMLFAQIQFFIQFGFFMLTTIGFSLIFSLGLFVTLMGILGPSGDTGNIRVIVKKLKDRFTRNDGTTKLFARQISTEPIHGKKF